MVETIIGVIVGWLLSSTTTYLVYRCQKIDQLKKEQRNSFRSKARFGMRSKYDVRGEQIKQNISVVLCSYKAKMKDDFVTIDYTKELLDTNTFKHEDYYFENIGKSDIYDFEFAVENPKNQAMFKRDLYTKYIKEGLIGYGVSSDRMLRKGVIVKLTVYYSEYDPVINIMNASLLVFYRDELGNVCEQAVFPDNNNIYEPTLISFKEWREHVSIDKNLEQWKRRLENKT